VWVRQRDHKVEVRYGAERIADHQCAQRRHLVVTCAYHHEGIPLGVRGPDRKTLVHLREAAPEVYMRPLEAYESAAAGGAQ